ncbi:MAG: transcription elongation factor GreB [Burkholderiales bacterium]|nr:transcription elongation factor GreB [Burkholderiales bacterium]
MSEEFKEDLDDEEVKIPVIKGQKNYMTPACYHKMLDERQRLVKVERPEIVNVVAWAASNGDRSENGDYLYGKKRLREIDRRIRFLNKRLEASEVIDPATRPPTDQVFFGATVLFSDQDGNEGKIRIVGIDEADASVGDVSWISPIARVFLKHREGDEVLLPTPKGVKRLDILEVTYTAEPPGKPHNF